MSVLHFLSIFLHIIAATFWIGGMLFLSIVLLPAIRNHSDRASLFRQTAVKFRTAGHIALGILLITGVFNLHARGISLNPLLMSETFQGMLGLKKLLLFVLIILINLIHDRFAGEKALKKDGKAGKSLILLARWLGRLNIFLGLIAVALGMIIVRGWIS